MVQCPACGVNMAGGAVFCSGCGTPLPTQPAKAPSGPWFQNYYRMRKKVIAIANQYWIEDASGRTLGYARQKIIAIKEKIPVFADDTMSQELFRIQQDQIMDMWGTFSIIDSTSGACVGKIRREALSSGLYKDSYLMLDPAGRQIGKVAERAGRGLLRKYVPGGALVPEQVVVEFYGREVAEIKQQFKIIGDIWEVDCSRIPYQFDRRVLLAAMLLMGMVERDRK
ncbi:MAG: zinc ribbon domain-containing protein [Candidatus Thermoplasmatota archaeon]|nr:zinc ribbon domain-containing protein [Candidatus Thermoplasmatota archaeon]